MEGIQEKNILFLKTYLHFGPTSTLLHICFVSLYILQIGAGKYK